MQLASGNVVSQWQLAGTSSDQVKQSIDLQLDEVLMASASGWFTSRPLFGWWVVMQRQLWAVLASCITIRLAPTFEFGNSNM